MRTDLPTFCGDEFEGKFGHAFSAYLKNFLVAPLFARTTNSILPSEGRLAMSKGWEDNGATTSQARNMYCPAFQVTGGFRMVIHL
jgi:hypothetical protein